MSTASMTMNLRKEPGNENEDSMKESLVVIIAQWLVKSPLNLLEQFVVGSSLITSSALLRAKAFEITME
ncbi:hypothetical protein PoB_006929400 [Plakobranchus ocellatus]|uniref:Uncharacterized protein n=1 Tax=Plakobranchus ocellatus TaxID=259542 RepID=A0AAV4DF12_9GAST|nr:hypothetical protein PoB_006929400 [Plakobranchus ocellatus]